MTAKITTLEPVFYLDTLGSQFHFIVLGVGGTGSDLVAKLCRYLSLYRSPDSSALLHDITFCDADVVEEKNLGRQNFFPADLGKNKAEIMALKCSTLFNMVVRAVPNYIEDGDTLGDIICISPRTPFIIGCVDNNATRSMLHEYFTSSGRRMFYLDAGNEEFAGQVALGYKSGFKSLRLTDGLSAEFPYVGRFDLPDITYHHPEMLEDDDKFASDLSCAERAVSNPQAMTANNEASTIIFQMVCNCIRGRTDYHYVAFDTLTSTRSVKFNTASILKSYGVRQVDSVVSAVTEINNSRQTVTVSAVTEINNSHRPVALASDDERFGFMTTPPLPNRPEMTREATEIINRVLGDMLNESGTDIYQNDDADLNADLNADPSADPSADPGPVSEETSDDSITPGDLLWTHS